MESMVKINKHIFYYGKRVIITGHTGFKGSWLSFVLKKQGAILMGISLEPVTTPSLYKEIEESLKFDSFILDINEYEYLEKKNITIPTRFHLPFSCTTLSSKILS